jgi:hypothetical protein
MIAVMSGTRQRRGKLFQAGATMQTSARNRQLAVMSPAFQFLFIVMLVWLVWQLLFLVMQLIWKFSSFLFLGMLE